MKLPLSPVFISLCVLLAALTGCNDNKSEITFSTPEWDSLTYPLGMRAYYVSASSREKAAELSLRIDVYVDGKPVQRSGGTIIHYNKPLPIEISSAIYFDKGDDARSGMIVSAFGKDKGDTGTSRFKLNIPDGEDAHPLAIRFDKQPVNPNGLTPLFAIVCGAKSLISADNPEQLLAHYESLPVIVFSLEASQTARKQLPAQEQQH